ncbi:MAG: aldehyde dehydrogenase family protein, partial [Microbacteriaceae bacterium]|nr:aldehyde dehydrogenase family protein [Microbacteriaceae bacterium]
PGHLRSARRRGAIPFLTRAIEHQRPIGVVGVITPWNYPFTLPASDVIPALIAGNAVVLLPDASTPVTADIVERLLREAGLPPDVLTVVHGGGRVHGDDLVATADYIMFTGSTATGRSVAEKCATRLIGFSGELGGKNPMIVLGDADVAAAARAAVRSCFSNSGQLCVSIERIYVVDELHDRFLAEFTRHVREMKLGVGFDWDIDMGPLISAAQFNRVTTHVADAVKRGATVVFGGSARPDIAPTFFEPTILTDVTDDMELGAGETFGPVVSVYRVADVAEAIRRANDSDYGLNASVWTRRPADVVGQIRSGTITVNEGFSASWASHSAPMGGMKTSGMGRRHGREGILKYAESQTVATQRLHGIAPIGNQSNRDFAGMLNRLLAIWNKLS